MHCRRRPWRYRTSSTQHSVPTRSTTKGQEELPRAAFGFEREPWCIFCRLDLSKIFHPAIWLRISEVRLYLAAPSSSSLFITQAYCGICYLLIFNVLHNASPNSVLRTRYRSRCPVLARTSAAVDWPPAQHAPPAPHRRLTTLPQRRTFLPFSIHRLWRLCSSH